MNNQPSTELMHHGIKGQKWGIRRFQPYPKDYSRDGKYTGEKIKVVKGTAKDTNDIYSQLTTKEKHFVADTKTKPQKIFIKPNEEKYLIKQILVKHGNKPATALDIWNQGNNEAAVSIMTSPKYRGKGLASIAVKEAVDWFDSQDTIRQFLWGVKSENISSRKLAEKHGFEMIPGSTEKWDDWVVYAKNKDKPVSKMSVYD